MGEGIDRAAPFTTAEPLDCLLRNGITFIGRYYSSSEWKNLTRTEAELISSRGLYIVAVFQDAANYADYFTYERGINDCSAAIARALNVGQPCGTPIYFAVDFEAHTGDPALGQVEAYFEGVQKTMRQHAAANGGDKWELGVYGTYDVVTYIANWIMDITYVWQTYAWSSGQEFGGWNLYQYEDDRSLAACGAAGVIDRVRSNGNGGGFQVS
ncbi:DUF1906 domain-containing protein [Paenibacillus elgii]|uniref:DUF1906 domain-containing protein n=1 Tax=Paenibacillus elgii TaxID=189691 RepID=UPI00204102E3|nr:DUF1906 domain-containing protein [Paenibacillus elgii]MCM3270934.1 DUF1906 domain-containing protein [Paenibacillus elgii]